MHKCGGAKWHAESYSYLGSTIMTKVQYVVIVSFGGMEKMFIFTLSGTFKKRFGTIAEKILHQFIYNRKNGF